MNKEKLVEYYGDDCLLFADGFDDAVIGVAMRCGMDDVVAYDYDKCIDILMKDMNWEEATEYFEYNVRGSYVGEKTPIFVQIWREENE